MYGNGHVYVYWRVASCFSINIRDVECKKPGVATFSMSTIDVSNSSMFTFLPVHVPEREASHVSLDARTEGRALPDVETDSLLPLQ